MMRLLRVIFLVFNLLVVSSADAVIFNDPPHTAATVAGHINTAATTLAGWIKDAENFIDTKIKWVKEQINWFKTETQLGQTVTELLGLKAEAEKAMEKVNGLRTAGQAALNSEAKIGMGDGFLPDEYATALQNTKAGAPANSVDRDGNPITVDIDGNPIGTDGGQVLTIFDKVKAHVAAAAGLNSDEKMQDNTDQAALNRALAELAYKQAAARQPVIKNFSTDIDTRAKEQKDTADISARIQVEQALLQNEQIKVASLQLLERAQVRVEKQREKQQRLQTLELKPMDIVTAAIIVKPWDM
jgi:hypothetical protein